MPTITFNQGPPEEGSGSSVPMPTADILSEPQNAAWQVLEMRERTLGPDHLEVAASLNNIAVLLKMMGRYDEAEQLYKRSISIKEKALGPAHPQVGACHAPH